MAKPLALFIALYKHHQGYFRALVQENSSFKGKVLLARGFLLPRVKGAFPSKTEIQESVAYADKRWNVTNPIMRFPLFSSLHCFYNRILAVILCHNYYAYFKNSGAEAIVVWNGKNLALAAAVATARRLKLKVLFIENAPLPNCLIVDDKGVNFENSLSRDPEYNRNVPVDDDKLQKLLATPLMPRASVRKDSAKKSTVVLPDSFYFLVFQKYSDAQILLFSPWIKDMEQLARTVFASLRKFPDSSPALVIKRHPSCKKGYDRLIRQLSSEGVIFADEYSTMELISKSSGVITVNSSVGVEALLMGRPVLSLGQAFYNIPGLVLHADDRDELTEKLQSLKEFVPEPKLRNGFLYSLRYHHCVEGTHRNPTLEHLMAMRVKISQVMAEVEKK